jgi:GAF domain-containing protein
MDKKSKYNRIIEQLRPLLSKSPTFQAQIATINAVLYHKMQNFFWVGVYYRTAETLHVGPYQGPLACQTLEYPRGVCWKVALTKKAVVLKNVEEFPDHIACDSRSKSEIALPILNGNGELIAVLDIDSDKVSTFDETDKEGLEKIIELLTTDKEGLFR